MLSGFETMDVFHSDDTCLGGLLNSGPQFRSTTWQFCRANGGTKVCLTFVAEWLVHWHPVFNPGLKSGQLRLFDTVFMCMRT